MSTLETYSTIIIENYCLLWIMTALSSRERHIYVRNVIQLYISSCGLHNLSPYALSVTYRRFGTSVTIWFEIQAKTILSSLEIETFLKVIVFTFCTQENDHKQPTCQYLKIKLLSRNLPDVQISHHRSQKASYNMCRLLYLMKE